MFKSIGHNLARLASFSGRDTRETFWPYALTLFGLTMVGCTLSAVPTFVGAMERMQRFAAEHPDQATVTQGPGSYSIQIQGNHPELMPDMHGLMTGMGIVVLLFVLLTAAAVVRRLHDRGSSGLWGLPPVIFLAIDFALMPKVFVPAGNAPEPSAFLLLFGGNLLYLVSLGWLGFLLARDGTDGPNRYGPDPVPAEVRARRRLPPAPRR